MNDKKQQVGVETTEHEKPGVVAGQVERFVMCCICGESLQENETDNGYCEDCRHGYDDLESLMDAAL